MEQSSGESSPMWTDGEESIDPEETWWLPGEVRLMEVKWTQLTPYFLTGRAFSEREIVAPPKYMCQFLPKRTSSPIRNTISEEEKQEIEKYNKFREQQEEVEQLRKQGKRVPQPHWPRPKTPEDHWNPGWPSPTKK